jgi:hypothetical protein
MGILHNQKTQWVKRTGDTEAGCGALNRKGCKRHCEFTDGQNNDMPTGDAWIGLETGKLRQSL